MLTLAELTAGLPLNPLPERRIRSPDVPHAPKRSVPLTEGERRMAIRNALRYFPPEHHRLLAGEFSQELADYGHIYMYRFLPNIRMKAYPIDRYETKCVHTAAIILMIMNNLDRDVAQFPEELVTYGGNGQVFSNWAQFWIVLHYLSIMSDEQTLVMYSGHPLGLFPSHKSAPRVVVTNGMVVPNYSSRLLYDKFFALGVSMYGQMTAGSYCYIGPQGIVHGTTITVLNAGRKYLSTDDLSGKVMVTSGLGGMSGAQAKAAVIAGCVGVIAEISESALRKRHEQGWLMKITDNLDECLQEIRKAKADGRPTSLGYHGNVVDLWERLVDHFEKTGERLADLGSDQTSCHNPFNGGYYPVGISFEEANEMMAESPENFKQLVQKSLRRHLAAINALVKGGMHFWDYGNAFLLECQRAGCPVTPPDDVGGTRFIYPSYVQDIMGDIFSMGFGPFRWVCCSGLSEDLNTTDGIALSVLNRLAESKVAVPEEVRNQYYDNMKWIDSAQQHDLVVGSQARILYSDQLGRVEIAAEFNAAVADGRLRGPVVVSRDHHDVSGTDSPFRETSNVYDGSAFTADMAVQNFVGDAFRGATWVSLHNGGGVGWGEAVNGGFGLVLDGSRDAADRAKLMLGWDVWNGIARRCWAGNSFAADAARRGMTADGRLVLHLPHLVRDEMVFDV